MPETVRWLGDVARKVDELYGDRLAALEASEASLPKEVRVFQSPGRNATYIVKDGIEIVGGGENSWQVSDNPWPLELFLRYNWPELHGLDATKYYRSWLEKA